MKITFRTTPLPPVAQEVVPTARSMCDGYRWWLGADENQRRRFAESRRRVVERHAGRAWGAHPDHIQEQYTSGSTGRRKHYRWGPGFKAVDWFFHRLVRSGAKTHKTASIQFHKLSDTGGANAISAIDGDIPRCDVTKHIYLSVEGRGEVPGLRDAIRGHNVYTSASTFAILDAYVGLSDIIDPDALVMFTGEALPVDLRERLLDKGLDVRDFMRCWDGGATFFTCQYGNRHWVDYLAPTRVEDGRLISDDLFNVVQPHLGYHNGDVVERVFGKLCPCGEVCSDTTFQNRTASHALVTPSGILATYEMLFDLFWNGMGVGRERVAAVCFGRFPGDVDYKLRVHYMVSDLADPDAAERAAGVLFFSCLGVRVEFVRGVEASRYKLRKIFYVE